MRQDIPYGSVEENYAEEYPVWSNRTPKRHTSKHRPLRWGMDEEEAYGRDEYKEGYYSKVFFLEFKQILSLILIENNQEDVAS